MQHVQYMLYLDRLAGGAEAEVICPGGGKKLIPGARKHYNINKTPNNQQPADRYQTPRLQDYKLQVPNCIDYKHPNIPICRIHGLLRYMIATGPQQPYAPGGPADFIYYFIYFIYYFIYFMYFYLKYRFFI